MLKKKTGRAISLTSYQRYKKLALNDIFGDHSLISGV